MREQTETKTFTITASPILLRRIERFLALLHFNSGFGHSGIFAMSLDGDGNEKVKVADIDRNLAKQVEGIGSIGYDVEIANDASYTGKFIDRNRECRWIVRPSPVEGVAEIYKNGQLDHTVPRQ